MTEFSTLLQQGAGNAWLFVPSAILLGALHGLEPGHSKTMMAAFIIAVRGTITQAILLGLAATLSHTAIVWIVALAGLHFGQQWNMETNEPYFQLATAAMIIAVAVWMMWRTWHHAHAADHAHHHEHDEHTKQIDTGHGMLSLSIQETAARANFRIVSTGHGFPASQLSIEIQRPDGTSQTFSFRQAEACLLSEQDIAEPHEFTARLHIAHGHHAHDYEVIFSEDHHHAHEDGLAIGSDGYQDAHELAHANDIRRRFSQREVTTGQIIVFGLTGGLIPCPASITVLLLCLQLKQFALGASLVLCFSIGLALTMVASGVLAALSVKHVASRWSGFGEFSRRAPYFSGVLILIVGMYLAYQGAHALI